MADNTNTVLIRRAIPSSRLPRFVLTIVLLSLSFNDSPANDRESPYAYFARLPPIRSVRQVEEIPTPRPEPVSNATPGFAIDDATDRIVGQREKLQEDVERILSDPHSRPAFEVRRPPWLTEIEKLLNNLQNDHQTHVRRLHSQFDTLDVLLKLRRENPRHTTDGQRGSVSTTERPANDNQPGRDDDKIATKPAATSVSPQAVTGEVVDRLSLADSRFGSGDYQLAAKIYERLKSETTESADRLWIEFQLAGCYRRLGETAKAEKLYRIVAGDKNDEFLSKHARWWLDVLERRSDLKQRIEQIETNSPRPENDQSPTKSP